LFAQCSVEQSEGKKLQKEELTIADSDDPPIDKGDKE
jgi:hypothetical protein